MADQSVVQALKGALKDKKLSYKDMQDIIKSTFDNGGVTREEVDNLKTIYNHAKKFDPDERSLFMLQRFIVHLDRKLKDNASGMIPLRLSQIDPGSFQARDTDLGKFSHGDFDVIYLPGRGELKVTLKVKFEWEEGVTGDEQAAFRGRLRDALQVWTDSGIYLKTRDLALNPIIRFRFVLSEVDAGEHFTVDVENDEKREWVGWDLNVWKGTSKETLVHELGHCLGNYDEYRGDGLKAFFERRMWWHDNDYLDDEKALMAGGTEFRLRYFDHFVRWVNENFKPLSINYEAFRLKQ